MIATQIVAGNKIVDVCAFGDTLIEKQCETQFKKSKIDKGVAFPTCLNVNNVVCHFSPLSTDTMELKAGDIVKMYVNLNSVMRKLALLRIPHPSILLPANVTPWCLQ